MTKDYDYKIKDIKITMKYWKKKKTRGKELHSRKMKNTFYNGGEQEFQKND